MRIRIRIRIWKKNNLYGSKKERKSEPRWDPLTIPSLTSNFATASACSNISISCIRNTCVNDRRRSRKGRKPENSSAGGKTGPASTGTSKNIINNSSSHICPPTGPQKIHYNTKKIISRKVRIRFSCGHAKTKTNVLRILPLFWTRRDRSFRLPKGIFHLLMTYIT